MKYIRSRAINFKRIVLKNDEILKSSMLPLSFCGVINFVILLNFFFAYNIHMFVLTNTINKIIVQLTRKVLHYKFYIRVTKIERQKKRDI